MRDDRSLFRFAIGIRMNINLITVLFFFTVPAVFLLYIHFQSVICGCWYNSDVLLYKILFDRQQQQEKKCGS